MKRIVVIGAGASGLMAAAAAAQAGAFVSVYEKNEKAGKKIYITGKGRCNLTNVCETESFFSNVVSNPKFLYSAVYGFDQQAVIRFMESSGCPVKIERGQRAFPVSDHASDVTKALTGFLRKHNVQILYNHEVKELILENQDPETGMHVCGIRLEGGAEVPADAVIVCTGGISYPSTGSTGDGYRFAGQAGLGVRSPSPALVPLVVQEEWPLTLQGIALKNVRIRVVPFMKISAGQTGEQPGDTGRTKKRNRPVYEGFGEMLFTHFGISGPLVLSASSYADFRKYPEGFVLHLDLKPALDEQTLAARIKKEFEAAPGKELVNAIRPLFPAGMCGCMAELVEKRTGVSALTRVRTIPEKKIREMAQIFKDVTLHVTGSRGFAEAVITRGGVEVRHINPSTMECRSVKNLYFAGEVLDVDALTGGFNLQIAWSTGHLAGLSAAAGGEGPENTTGGGRT